MVARNPLFQKWTIKKFKATVINDIWPEIILFSLVATMVTLVSRFTDRELVFDTGLLTVLGTVLGLVISFRTSSAYERYQDGRKMWTLITISSRNLAQMIWIHVPTERPSKDGAGQTALQSIIEKKTMVNLVQAFSVACKHYIRGEAGVYYEDLFPLICVLPRYAATSSDAIKTVEHMLPLWQASEDDVYKYDEKEAVEKNVTSRSVTPTLEKQMASGDGTGQAQTRSAMALAQAIADADANANAAANPNPNATVDSQKTAAGAEEITTAARHHPIRSSSAPAPGPHGRDNTLVEDSRISRQASSSIGIHETPSPAAGGTTRPSPHHTHTLPTPSRHHSPPPPLSLSSSYLRGKKKFDPEQALPQFYTHRPLRPARDPPETKIGDYFPIVRFVKWIVRSLLRKAKPVDEVERERRRQKKVDDMCQSNVPLEICLFLSSYTAFLMKAGLITPAIATGMTNNLTIMQDTMSQLERIGNTPLPFAYQAHLRLSVWLYLFFLPFQIYTRFGYLTIPGTAFATFLLVGFLEIGQEIENPFNYDLNDLDLDYFCLSIQRELHEITAHIDPNPDSFVFSFWNQPFAPTDRRPASELVATEPYQHPDYKDLEPGIESVRSTLVRNWRNVDRLTRDIRQA
ncbi:hypothetical protein AX16_005757 [Volvariella volvacea WC 439]|nr:hypothetical protein AX16_005757 [Volvariella volvacea WC 439]